MFFSRIRRSEGPVVFRRPIRLIVMLTVGSVIGSIFVQVVDSVSLAGAQGNSPFYSRFTGSQFGIGLTRVVPGDLLGSRPVAMSRYTNIAGDGFDDQIFVTARTGTELLFTDAGGNVTDGPKHPVPEHAEQAVVYRPYSAGANALSGTVALEYPPPHTPFYPGESEPQTSGSGGWVGCCSHGRVR